MKLGTGARTSLLSSCQEYLPLHFDNLPEIYGTRTGNHSTCTVINNNSQSCQTYQGEREIKKEVFSCVTNVIQKCLICFISKMCVKLNIMLYHFS